MTLDPGIRHYVLAFRSGGGMDFRVLPRRASWHLLLMLLAPVVTTTKSNYALSVNNPLGQL